MYTVVNMFTIALLIMLLHFTISGEYKGLLYSQKLKLSQIHPNIIFADLILFLQISPFSHFVPHFFLFSQILSSLISISKNAKTAQLLPYWPRQFQLCGMHYNNYITLKNTTHRSYKLLYRQLILLAMN